MKKVFAIIIISAVFLSYNLYERGRKSEYPSNYTLSNASYLSDVRLTKKNVHLLGDLDTLGFDKNLILNVPSENDFNDTQEKIIESTLKDESTTNPTTVIRADAKTPQTGVAKNFYIFFSILAASIVVLIIKEKSLFVENK